MKAIMLRETGGPDQLTYEEVEDPAPEAGEVLVRLHAAALNRRDIYITYDQYPGVQLPAIPGSDGAGEIADVGSDVSDLSIGSEVIINPGLGWGDDIRKKNPDFNTLGVPKNGTFAQYVKIPRENIFSKPSHLSWEEAAALPLGGLTAYRALITKGQVKEGETVLIPGIGGGVATYLVQFATALGTHVYVTSSKNEKIAAAKNLGAIGGVNYTGDDWHKQLKSQTGGVDLSVDSIGGEVFHKLLSLGKIGSRIVTFGATKGPVPNMVMPKIFLKEISVLGSTSGSPQEFGEMVQFVEKHQIRPVLDQIYSLEDVVSAQKRMANGDNFGKIVLTIPQG